MLLLRYARRWQAANIMLLAGVLCAALMPAVWFWDDRRSFLTWFVNVDKWLHAMTFVFLALWFAGQYQRAWYWRIGAGLILFGILIEICQRMVTYRSAEWFDLLADAIGIGIGLLIAAAGLGGWSLHIETWVARRNNGDRSD